MSTLKCCGCNLVVTILDIVVFKPVFYSLKRNVLADGTPMALVLPSTADAVLIPDFPWNYNVLHLILNYINFILSLNMFNETNSLAY